jgi:hypothetical protein
LPWRFLALWFPFALSNSLWELEEILGRWQVSISCWPWLDSRI